MSQVAHLIPDYSASDRLRSLVEVLLEVLFPDELDNVPDELLDINADNGKVVRINFYQRRVAVDATVSYEEADRYAQRVLLKILTVRYGHWAVEMVRC